MKQTVYYYETPIGNGSFLAVTDDFAKQVAPPNALVLYHESDTKDGKPFIVIFDKRKL